MSREGQHGGEAEASLAEAQAAWGSVVLGSDDMGSHTPRGWS